MNQVRDEPQQVTAIMNGVVDEQPRLVDLVREGAIRLNLGCGRHRMEGWVNIDRNDGTEAYPLPQYADGSADEIRASHILEHFSFAETSKILAEWHRVLRPNGRIRIAVPDLDKIIDQYRDGETIDAEAYLMGGQTSKDDFHGAVFNEMKLRQLMRFAGFVKLRKWEPDIHDCSAHPVSLNIEGVKVDRESTTMRTTIAVCSMPRLGFTSHAMNIAQTLRNTGCNFLKCGGAWWHHGMDLLFDRALQDKAEFILATDYDTIFQPDDAIILHDFMRRHPEVDAIAPLQLRRGDAQKLTGIVPDGHAITPDGHIAVSRSFLLENESFPVRTAHFGLTLIRASAIRRVPRPWFHERPNEDGSWEGMAEGRASRPGRVGKVDADIWFWRAFEKAGCRLHQSTRVSVGHMEEYATWPDVNGNSMVQLVGDFEQDGPPVGVWQ